MKLIDKDLKIYIFKNKYLNYYLKKENLINRQYDENNKPFVKGINFSISHSKKYSALIISKKYNVGIDILEKNRQIKNFNLIIKDWNEKPKTNKKFIKLWTIKESVIKIYSNNTLRNINNVNVFKKFCIYNKQKIYYKTIKNKHIICTYSYFKK